MDAFISWLFIIALFIMCLALVALGVIIFILAPTGAGITFGILSVLAGIGIGVGGGYLLKHTIEQ